MTLRLSGLQTPQQGWPDKTPERRHPAQFTAIIVQ